MFYVPDVDERVRAAYRSYETRRAIELRDAPDSVVVVPEIFPHFLPRFEYARRMLWWLSVDNALQVESDRKRLDPNPNRFRLDDTFAAENRIEHLAQSEYARLYVAAHGQTARMLTDYLSPEFLRQVRDRRSTPKRDIVTYNPKKGLEFTQQLMAASAGRLDWVPIENMTPGEVGDLLASAKVYVDFGEHPGRDRIPREAGLAGCVVITGTRGSAGNGIDIPIPPEYVIGEESPDAVNRIVAAIEQAMSGYDAANAAFAPYRAWIIGHEDVFAAEVEAIVPPRARGAVANNRQERRAAMNSRAARTPGHARGRSAPSKRAAHR
jgi:hypothetical protein